MIVNRRMEIRYMKKSLKQKNKGLREQVNLIITKDNDIKTKTSMKLQLANKCFSELGYN